MLDRWSTSETRTISKRFIRARPSTLAAAVAYNMFFALVPVLVATLAGASLIGASGSQIDDVRKVLTRYVPGSVAGFLSELLQEVGGQIEGARGPVIVTSVLVALWSGARAFRVLNEALSNITGVQDQRHWFHRRLLSSGFTAGFALTLVASSLLLVAGDPIGAWLTSHVSWGLAGSLWKILSLPLGASILVVFLWSFFRWGVAQRLKRAWSAALLGALGIFLVSLGLRFLLPFISGRGSLALLGSVAALLLWMHAIAWVMLAAAAFMAEHERNPAIPEVPEQVPSP